ncbi:hypothetical protein MLD52_07050 [Puniceicoccaceae bacterium K14]|nr:hypothetical protein [Puniceicoccaceae bacterium K14]
MSQEKKAVLVIGIIVFAIALTLVFFGDLQNPKQISRERLTNLEQSIISYIEENGRAPQQLSALGLPEEQLQDHLGEPFIYTVTEDTVTLLSYGSDKEKGGFFFKRDYSVEIDLPLKK